MKKNSGAQIEPFLLVLIQAQSSILDTMLYLNVILHALETLS